jgi:inorganic phosphate transporter, PiT family
MGLIVLILVGILPGFYALNMNASADQIHRLEASAVSMSAPLDAHSTDAWMGADDAAGILSNYVKNTGAAGSNTFTALAAMNHQVVLDLAGKDSFREFSPDQVKAVRGRLYLLGDAIGKMLTEKRIADPGQVKALSAYKQDLTGATQYIPTWVKFAVAIALGLGTMIGWKRIVVTVGERIGKTHLTYAQGASAELVAMLTIGAADLFGLPVSTTHVLSSGVAGTMAANRSGLQLRTIRNIAMAWVLTLPACVLLGATTFSFAFFLIFTSPIKKVLLIAAMMVAIGLIVWLSRNLHVRPAPSVVPALEEAEEEEPQAVGSSVDA